jgi:tRNA (Thr-GGU) A37 N-methylase
MDVCLLKGLEEWSYVWLLWDFDKRVLPGNGSVKSLVQPPRAPGKIGVFACRTPHRPIAIGLSLAKLIKVEGKKVYIEGSDVVHNTTLLDIKPYHHTADSPWDKDLRQPQWVGSVDEKAFAKTIYTPEASETITSACVNKKLQFWTGEEDVQSLFNSISNLICNQDMRSQWRRGTQVKFVMDFDNLLLTLNYKGDEVIISEVAVVKKIKQYHDEDQNETENK